MDDWPALVREHGPLVWRVVHRLLSDYADASDAFQETFASALRASRRQPVENWPGLLHRLATICSLNRLRQRYRERARTEPLSNCDDVPALASGPVEHAEAAELALGLRQALARLSSQEAEVFCLRCLEECTYQEIADQLCIEPNAVGVILHRARSRLRELLAPYLTNNRPNRE